MGFTIIEAVKSPAPFDIIAERKEERWAINVKLMIKKGKAGISRSNIEAMVYLGEKYPELKFGCLLMMMEETSYNGKALLLTTL